MTEEHVKKSPDSDIVISSRVRLARNLRDFPFPFKMNREQEAKVLERVKDSVAKSKSEFINKIFFVELNHLNPIDKQALVEKHLISPDLAESQRVCGALISEDEKISIMINEEDHLRMQCLFSGMQLDKAWELCNRIDDMLEESVGFAFDKRYGYLTCCPTNIGTGMRASAMIHLPALTMTGYITQVLEACNKLGIAVRGLYGENTEALGNMFQISNQVTIGQTEEEIISSITNITDQIVERELVIRRELYDQSIYRFEDKVYRSLGILQNARMISNEESLKLLSDVRLGVNMGIIQGIQREALDEIHLFIQPASLQKVTEKPLNADERDIRRAELIRGRLTSKGN